MKTYLYGRFSTGRQDEAEGGDSERRQVEGGKKFAKQKGWPEPKVFFDKGVSAKAGKNLDREFANLLGHLKSGDRLICEDLDRISRMHPWKAKAKIFEIIESGVSIWTWRDGNEYSEDNIDELNTFLVADVTSGVAFVESAKKKSRQLGNWEGWLQRIEAGEKIRVTRTPPWIDFRNTSPVEKIKGEFSLNAKAKIVRRMFELADEGIGSIRIVKQMIKEGHPPLAGNKNSKWDDVYVRNVLREKTVIGQLNLATRNLVFENFYPAAISPDLFYRVQGKIAQSRLGGAPTIKEVNPFRSILFCKCGSKMYTNGNGRAADYYACQNAKLGKGCKFHFVSKEGLRQAVIGALVKEAEYLKPSERQKTEKETINAEMTDIEQQLEKLTDVFLSDKDAPKTLVNRMKQLEVRQAELKEKFNELAADETTDYGAMLDEMHKALQSDDPAMLQRSLRNVVEKVIVDTKNRTGHVYFHPNFRHKDIAQLQKPETLVYSLPFSYSNKPDGKNLAEGSSWFGKWFKAQAKGQTSFKQSVPKAA